MKKKFVNAKCRKATKKKKTPKRMIFELCSDTKIASFANAQKIGITYWNSFMLTATTAVDVS